MPYIQPIIISYNLYPLKMIFRCILKNKNWMNFRVFSKGRVKVIISCNNATVQFSFEVLGLTFLLFMEVEIAYCINRVNIP